MSEKKPSIPKGTRDFIPTEVAKREYIFNTIRDTFRLFGYQAIETPAMENLSSLLGKYGEEGDKLLFKILNSGDFLSELTEVKTDAGDPAKIGNLICEKGLRYDLTVPFARFIVQHRNEISFPFKRFQIQPVWRADRPQKGRYREFYQCDADTIGSDSLLNEAELIKIIDIIFNRIRIPVTIKLNNRKILAGIAETIGESERFSEITTAMDKFEKIGKDNVMNELRDKGIGESSITMLLPVLEFNGSTIDKMEFLVNFLKDSGTGLKGLEEIRNVIDLVKAFGIRNEILLDLSLARGLNYYTGVIIEVKARDVSIGSICGGGRYDNLTGFFGLPGISGVGISFGADRIYDVMEQLHLFPSGIKIQTRVLFINFGNREVLKVLPFIEQFRDEGINTELYPDTDKIKKQLSYADNNKIPYVVLAGEDELSKGLITLRNMITGDQHQIDPTDAIQLVKDN